ncbi:MAG: phosphoribosyltransferase [Gammaproteobacteria bacterium]|nr:phosphoribosyltransferase [Gammaproteobacteria bacterium]NNJ85005.1 phosphoribosyltransferase [Gammaproteobacteria bacterium]
MHSLDRLTVTLAEEFNANQSERGTGNSGQDTKTLRIRLGSVYVSGNTINAAEKLSEAPLTIHFFAHGGFTGKFESPEPHPSLFIWQPVRSENGDETNADNEKQDAYGRIGKTPAIGRRGRKHFLVPRFDEHDKPLVARTPAETYDDWQQPVSSLLASGHWQYESHHDFITLNIRQAIELAFLGHEPLASYLFHEILSPLRLAFEQDFDRDLSITGQQLRNRVDDDIKRERLQNYEDDWNAQAVVYPFHPNTAAAVNNLLDCFLEEKRSKYRNRFIPVQPVRRRQGHGAILFSPLALERVQNLLKNSDGRAPNVLLFDDAIITGHTVDELIGTLKKNGAADVRTVAILDRRRLPAEGSERERTRFFWRFDLADIGAGNACPLCKAIDFARQFEQTISSSRNKERTRVSEWIQIWQPVSPVSQWHRGLPRIPLEKPLAKKLGIPKDNVLDSRYQVRLKDSTAIAAYAAEIFTMTGLDDESLSLSAKAKKAGQPLSSQTRIELFATQILLFGQEFGKDVLSDILIQLLMAANETEEETPHTALASLVTLLLSSHPIDHERVIKEALYSDPRNMDVELAVANLIWSGKLNGSEYPDTQRLLTTIGVTVAERYDRLHMELATLTGNPHSTPLCRFQDSSLAECAAGKGKALHSLEQLADLLQPIDSMWARNPDKTDKKNVTLAEKKREKVAKSEAAKMREKPEVDDFQSNNDNNRFLGGFNEGKEELKEEIRKIKDMLRNLDCDDNGKHESAKAAVKVLFRNLKKFSRKFIFLHFDKESLSKFPDPVEQKINALFPDTEDFRKAIEEKRIDKTHPHPTLGISLDSSGHPLGNKESVYLIWDWGIQNIVERLLLNSLYAKESIQDPWHRKGEEEKHRMWLSVRYTAKNVEISLCNTTDKPVTDIVKRIKKQHLKHIEKIGGNIRFGQHHKDSQIFQVTVSVPHAGCCRDLQVNKQN